METQTAGSYYLLFQTEYKQNKNRSLSPNNNEYNVAKQSNDIWVEDKWTDEDTRQAAAILNVSPGSALNAKSHLILRYENEAAKNWDKFYTRNQSNFFKDRHYLMEVFPELAVGKVGDASLEPFVLLEVGCGVGNAVLPLLEQNSRLHVWGFDLSSVAIDLMKKDERFIKASQNGRARGAVWDITANSCPLMKVDSPEANGALLLFCLSAISPDKMKIAAKHVMDTLKPGAYLLFRDYGRFDEAQMKLGTSRGKRLSENFYVKQDGTRCYYFDMEDIRNLFEELDEVELNYIRRVYQNRGDNTKRRRVWIQGRFRKPLN